jgi:hypothetical protein
VMLVTQDPERTEMVALSGSASAGTRPFRSAFIGQN